VKPIVVKRRIRPAMEAARRKNGVFSTLGEAALGPKDEPKQARG
jgi:hypothetical protein